MRNRIFYTVLALSFFIAGMQKAAAQITITKANMPIAGQTIFYTISNDSIDVTATDTNTTWDFSHIIPVSQDTYKYVSAAKANVLYTLQFKGDVALDVKIPGLTGTFEFFKTATSQYTSEGLGVTLPVIKIPTSIPYTNPDVIYRFPVQYGNIDSASFFGTTTLTAGITVTVVGKRINIVDGWGKVKTPYKTYNCIRLKSVISEVDSFFGIGIDRSRIEYKWLSTSEQVPVFEAVVPTGAAGGGMTLTYRDSYKHIIDPNGPVVDFNVADTNVFTNDTVAINNNTTGAVNYSWVITPATFTYLTGSTATSKSPKVIFNKIGLYTISINATGFGGANYLTKTNYINVTHNTGIEPVMNGIRELELYPNPTSEDVQLNTSENLNGNSWYSIINAAGKTIYSGTIAVNNGQSSIKMTDFPSGLYLIRIQNGTQVFEGRVVKE